MKRKILIFIFTVCCLIFLFFPHIEAASWKFLWENTTVEVPVGDSIDKYKNIPQARLYRDNVLLSDAEVTYNTEGDWLYYFKDVNTKKTGEYKVWYKAYDTLYSPGTCTGYKSLITFRVTDKVKPVIDLVSDIFMIRRGDSYDLSLNYNAYDNYALKGVSVMENIDVNCVGNYPVRITAVDESDNSTTVEFTAVVYESEAPVLSCSAPGNVIEVPLNSDFDIKSFFSATDRVDGDISSDIIYPPFYNDALGEYPYEVSVTNKAGLTSYLTAFVSVVDDEAPVILLTTHNLILDYKDDISNLDYKSYILDITDNAEINYECLSITSNLEQKVGSYYILYTYTDGISSVSDTINVMVVCEDKPVIRVDDITVYTKGNCNLMDYIHVEDPSDDNILASVTIDDQGVDYTKAGTYYATVSAMNSSGMSESVRFKITVKNTNWFSRVNAPLAIVMIATSALCLGFVIFLVYYFAIRKKMH